MKEEDKADLKHIFPKKDKGFVDFLFEEKYPQLGLVSCGIFKLIMHNIFLLIFIRCQKEHVQMEKF